MPIGGELIKQVETILNQKTNPKRGDLYHVVEKLKRTAILELAQKHSTPFYAFDQNALDRSIDAVLTAFSKEIPSLKVYYPVKINHHRLVVEHAVSRGLGLDVGSPREIDLAVQSGSKDIVYFSPGKTIEDLKHALKHREFLTIHMDSFGELKKLGDLTNVRKEKIRAGVRIHTDLSGDWKKYGIHLKNLKNFWEESRKYPYINLVGIHFHRSRNSDASFYADTIKELGDYLIASFSRKELQSIRYVDFGGGFEVYDAEGYYPFKTPQGSIIKTVDDYFGKESRFELPYYVRESIEIDVYAKQIGLAIKNYLSPIVNAVYYLEPGRILVNDSFSIILSVADVKDAGNLVLDGGVNMVGWQRFEHEYFPLINLSAPSKEEIKCNMWGNLCTTWDIWGYYCYAKCFHEKDIIVVPNQGALTYSLAQNFIHSIPPVYKI